MTCANIAPLALSRVCWLNIHLLTDEGMHAGSNDGTKCALAGLQALHNTLSWASQAVPVLSHAALQVRHFRRFPPSNLETKPLSIALASEALDGLQPAFSPQVSQ